MLPLCAFWNISSRLQCLHYHVPPGAVPTATSTMSQLSASLPVHCKWVQLLEDEFFQQGDKEKLHGLPVSPLFDRCKPGITKSQVRKWESG